MGRGPQPKDYTREKALAANATFRNAREKKLWEAKAKRILQATAWEELEPYTFQESVLFLLQQQVESLMGTSERVRGKPFRDKQVLSNEIYTHTLHLAILKLRTTMQVEKENQIDEAGERNQISKV